MTAPIQHLLQSPPARHRRLRRPPGAAVGRTAHGRAVHLLRSHGAGALRARRGARRAAASAHRAGDGDVSVRGRDPPSRQPRLGAADPARRGQLDDGRPRHRALGALAGRSCAGRACACTACSSGSRCRRRATRRSSRPSPSPGRRPRALERAGRDDCAWWRAARTGVRSPVAVASPLFYAEARSTRAPSVDAPPEHEERASTSWRGDVDCGGMTHAAATMLVFREGSAARSARRAGDT